MGLNNTPADLVPGTLEMLISSALASGSNDGYAFVLEATDTGKADG